MDEIIYLEPDEEITSVIDKIKDAKSLKLGLVVPREATLLQSVVNLRLLSREAASLGKEIAIITTDRIGRNLAAQVGIVVYNSVEEQKPIYQPPPPRPSSEEIIELDMAEKPPEKEESPAGVKVHHFQEGRPVIWKRKSPPILKPQLKGQDIKAQAAVKDFTKVKKIIWPIVAILVVLLGIAAFLLLPKANVKIFVASENLNKSVQLAVSNKIANANLEQNIFPGELVEVTRETQEKFSTTGKKNIGEKTKGTLTVYNAWDSDVHEFSEGTKFSSSSKTFLATSDFTIPGSSVKEGNLVPGSVSVNIEAENPGEEYNVKAGRFTILGLPAAQQEKIYGTSNNDLAGGFSKEVQVVSQNDYENAKKKLVDQLSSEVKKEFDEKTIDQKVLEKAINIPEPEVTSSANIDQEAKEFEMKIKYKEQAMVFNFESFKEFIVKLLEKQVPSDKMVAIANDEDIGIMVDKVQYEKGELDLTANVAAKIASKISAEKIKTAILGRKVTEAENYIKGQEGISKVEIKMRPSWWFMKIPNMERNVNIQIEYLTQ